MRIEFQEGATSRQETKGARMSAMDGLTEGDLYFDEDGDVCVKAEGDNLVLCPAYDDRDGALLHPQIIGEMVRLYNAHRRASRAVSTTPDAKWRKDGEPDPHGNRYDCPRERLAMGNLTDDELANAVFMYGDSKPPIEALLAGTAHSGMAYLTAAKDRIRWLSRQLVAQAASAPFQDRVDPWMQACFGAEVSADKLERGDRLLEEVLELLQSGNYPPERIAMLSSYVWSRDIGEPAQEVGGIMVTLAAYCLAHGLDMHDAGETELARIWTKVEKIRAKQAAKPRGSALPQAWNAPAPSDGLREGLIRDVYEAAWEMDEAFGVREDSFQMAASEKLCNALVALRDAMPEVDRPRAALTPAPAEAAL